jgi:rubrerythrin
MLRLIPVLALALSACGSTSTSEVTAPEPSGAASALPAEGQRYDPAIDPSEVPDGAWMCDMGTVHYAAPHEGDCPVCGMALTRKE